MPSKALIENVANFFNITDVEIINKDFYVVEVLKKLLLFPPDDGQFIFSGGTSLTKAFDLTKRMSEDIDLRIILPKHPTSRSKLRIKLSEIKNKVLSQFCENFDGVHLVKAGNENRYLEYEINYPRISKYSALRDRIKVDLAYFPVFLPPTPKPINSLITLARRSEKSMKPDIESFPCIVPEEILADKLVALPRRYCTDKEKGNPFDPNLVRHVYDIFKIFGQVNEEVTYNLIPKIIEAEKMEYGGKSPLWSAEPVKETLDALRELHSPEFSGMFSRYAADMIYDANYPDYGTMIEFVAEKITVAFSRLK
jgi:predicted nucleotidyltransferase component of viral defense system